MAKQIKKSEFTADVVENRLSKAELAQKYELPKTEITKILKTFGLRISPKRFVTYQIVDDVASTDVLSSTSSENYEVVAPQTNEEIPVSEEIN